MLQIKRDFTKAQGKTEDTIAGVGGGEERKKMSDTPDQDLTVNHRPLHS